MSNVPPASVIGPEIVAEAVSTLRIAEASSKATALVLARVPAPVKIKVEVPTLMAAPLYVNVLAVRISMV